jgi:signal transduction histidine kinase
LFFKSLISRVIILSILLLTVGIGTFTLFHIRRSQNHLIAFTKESAKTLLSTVENSILNSMLIGNCEDVQAILEMVGRNQRIVNVRIFHPNGTVLRSSHPQEIGGKVNPSDLALFLNGHNEEISSVIGEEVLGVTKPIISGERCFLCHGTGNKVIGVLNLNYSLADTTQKLRKSSQLSMLSTAFVIILLSGGVSFILVRFVKRPIQDMADKMAQVKSGDLSVRMVLRYADEVGSLMRSFNSMVVNLEKAKKELQEYHYRQMERADRLASVGEMATGIAHEIKNPLAGISGAISVLADDFAEGDPRKEVVGKVLEQIARLDKTATDLLYFGRPGKPEFSYLDINAIVTKTLFFVSQHSEAENIRRVKELSDDLPQVWVDEKQMQQVFFNVIINAIQAMKEGGTLITRTDSIMSEGREFVRVLITDTGQGIPPDEIDKVFVPFYTTKTQGTGLGLPICRQLVEQHGGTISVRSSLTEGTTFIIKLPVVVDQSTNGKEGDNAQT